MPNLLPTLFIVLGAGALVLTLFWLWQSMRHAFAHAGDVVHAGVISPGTRERAGLLAKKQALLLALKDLEAERDIGKLSEADFKELNARYRAQAREVLKKLDTQLEPHRQAARALLDGKVAAAAPPAPVDVAPATATVETDGACPTCATANDRDAVFCKKCGTRLTPESGA